MVSITLFSIWRAGNTNSRTLFLRITEGLHGLAREAHVPFLLEAYGIPSRLRMLLQQLYV